LADGRVLQARRFLPLGEGDHVLLRDGELWVLVKRDDVWINIFESWTQRVTLEFLGRNIQIEFKEIETQEELERFETLRKFHYRGGGGALLRANNGKVRYLGFSLSIGLRRNLLQHDRQHGP
jgi:hypothetical protein